MNFQPQLAALVMAGQKTQTRRVASPNPRSPWYVERCGLKIDQTYAVCPGRGQPAIGRVRVAFVHLERLNEIDNVDARREGFADRAAFVAGWREIHDGNWDGDTLVWRVCFSVDNASRRAGT